MQPDTWAETQMAMDPKDPWVKSSSRVVPVGMAAKAAAVAPVPPAQMAPTVVAVAVPPAAYRPKPPGGTCGGGGGAGAGQGGPSGGGQGAGKGGEGASGGGAIRSAGGGGGACAYEVPEVCTDWDLERLLMGAGGSAGASGGCAADSLDQGRAVRLMAVPAAVPKVPMDRPVASSW